MPEEVTLIDGLKQEPTSTAHRVLGNSTLEVTPSDVVELRRVGRTGWIGKIFRYHISEQCFWLAEEEVFTNTADMVNWMASELGSSKFPNPEASERLDRLLENIPPEHRGDGYIKEMIELGQKEIGDL